MVSRDFRCTPMGASGKNIKDWNNAIINAIAENTKLMRNLLGIKNLLFAVNVRWQRRAAIM